MKKPSADNTKLVSFKLSSELYKKLEIAAKGKTDEAGLPISPSVFARRLVLDRLKKL